MNRTKRSRSKPVEAPERTGILEYVVLGISAALLVMSTLVPSEGAVRGSGALLAVAWMLLLALIHLFAWQRGLKLRCRMPDVLVLLLALWMAISTAVMAWQGNPRHTLNAAWQWAALFAGYWCCRQLFTTTRRGRLIAAILISTSVGVSAHGLYQFAIGMPHNRARYEQAPEREKRDILVENGVNPEPNSPMRAHFENRLRSTEPFATFGLANSLAGVVATWLIVLVAWQLDLPAGTRSWLRVALAIAALLMLACLVLTKSRSAWIAFAVGCVGLAVIRRRLFMRHRLLLPISGLALIAIIGIGIFSGALDKQVLTEARLSLEYRLQYWQAALQMTMDHPWFGCGPGNFQDYYSQYKLPMASETVADPHNFLFEFAATAGLPTVLLLLLLLVAWSIHLMRANRDVSDPGIHRDKKTFEQNATALYVGAAIGGLVTLVYSWIVNIPAESDPWFGIPILLSVDIPVAGIVLALLHRSDLLSNSAGRAVPFALAVVVMCVNLLAAGGISYLGVGQSLWVLLALALNQRDPPVAASRWMHPGLALAVSGGLLLACYLTGYSPVLKSQAHLDEARAVMRTGLDDARSAAAVAAVADPWSPEPWQQLAQIDLQLWLRGDASARNQFEKDLAESRRRNRRSQALEMSIGAQYLNAYQTGGFAAGLQKSLVAYRRAARLYPNSNYIHAQVAWVAHLAGEFELAGQHAAKALQLDAANPHWEQQLRQRRIEDFGRGKDVPNEPSPHASDAEQIAVWLRSRYYRAGGD